MVFHRPVGWSEWYAYEVEGTQFTTWGFGAGVVTEWGVRARNSYQFGEDSAIWRFTLSSAAAHAKTVPPANR